MRRCSGKRAAPAMPVRTGQLCPRHAINSCVAPIHATQPMGIMRPALINVRCDPGKQAAARNAGSVMHNDSCSSPGRHFDATEERQGAAKLQTSELTRSSAAKRPKPAVKTAAHTVCKLRAVHKVAPRAVVDSHFAKLPVPERRPADRRCRHRHPQSRHAVGVIVPA